MREKGLSWSIMKWFHLKFWSCQAPGGQMHAFIRELRKGYSRNMCGLDSSLQATTCRSTFYTAGKIQSCGPPSPLGQNSLKRKIKWLQCCAVCGWNLGQLECLLPSACQRHYSCPPFKFADELLLFFNVTFCSFKIFTIYMYILHPTMYLLWKEILISAI